MSAEVVAQLRVIQHQAAEVARSMRAARDQLPAESVGWDDDRAASVQIDVTGSPVGIRVADDWDRQVPSDRLGSAVVQAGYAAAAQQGRELSQILSDPIWRTAPSRQDAGWAGATIPAPVIHPVVAPVSATARTLNELAEAVLGELRDARRRPAAPTADPAGRGTAADGAVVVTLSAGGLTGCEIDSDWVAGRTGFAVSLAASEALSAARLDLARAVFEAEPAAIGRRLDGMLSEAMAFLVGGPTPPRPAGSPTPAGEQA